MATQEGDCYRQLRAKFKSSQHWAGEGDALALVQRIPAKADETVGSGLWRKLKK